LHTLFKPSNALIDCSCLHFMPPDYEIRNPIGVTVPILELPGDKKIFNVFIEYCDSEKNRYKENYHIDLNSYVFKEKIVRYDIERYLIKLFLKLSTKSKSELIKLNNCLRAIKRLPIKTRGKKSAQSSRISVSTLVIAYQGSIKFGCKVHELVLFSTF
jgi:hypothetical protein